MPQHLPALRQHQPSSPVAPVLVAGQFYVMMNPEVLQTASPRTIAPRTHTYTA